MFDRLRNGLLRLLRVPPQPEPPFGRPDSIRVFRASRKLYYWRLCGWGASQVAALVGILFWLGVLGAADREGRRARQENVAAGLPASALQPGSNRPPTQALKDVARKTPPQVFALLRFAELLGLVVYLGQLGVTYAAVRLDYELRWYLVTDRSLRIRSGLWQVQEMTMSFANLQQVVVSQGPLQRLLGLADVQVRSAGGGDAQSSPGKPQDSMHQGVFHGVDNAGEIRDLILERLRHFREAGLGDPDDQQAAPAHGDAIHDDTLAAARELLAEARSLRRSVTGQVT
jgi:hypothetical protein